MCGIAGFINANKVKNAVIEDMINEIIGDPKMDQGACYAFAFIAIEGEDFTIKCHKCRSLCPNCFGSRNRNS